MRIISLAPSNTEILYALGLGEHIIGVTTYCDYPNQAKDKFQIGSWITTHPEKIKELSPDLIFTSYFLPEPLRDWKEPGRVVHVAPKTLADVYESILVIGKATKHFKQAQELVTKMQIGFEEIKKSNETMKQSSNLRIYMEEWPKPPMVSGNWVPEIVTIAGGIPILSKKGKPSSEFSLSQLTKLDPYLMIFHWCGFGERFNKEMIRKRPGWGSLQAVKNNLLFAIDDSLLNRPGPRLVEGTKRLQEFLLQMKSRN